MINITVDLGNYNIKYFGENKGSFSAKYSEKFNANGEMHERIQIGDKITYIGSGELEREFNKVEKNYKPQLLYALSKATNESDINLCILLPIAQLPNKHKLIEELKGQTFKFKINDKERTININKVAVLGEGFVSFFSLENRNADTLIIDVGSRTINYSSFIDSKIEKSFTEKLGVFDLYTSIKELENAKGNDYIEEDIERLIKRGYISVPPEIYIQFLKDILNRTKSKVSIKNYRVVFVGGGALMLKSFIEANTPAIVHEDAAFANVIGAHKLSENVWKGMK